MPSPRKRSGPPKEDLSYRHPEADLPARPEIGAQAHFKKAKPPAAYRCDSSPAPAMDWDGQNPAREPAEALIAQLSDYNRMVFRVRQACFPRTGAWENLKKSLRVEFEDTVWDHLAGTTSAPFPAGEHGQIAVKVIDPRGNELLVVKTLKD